MNGITVNLQDFLTDAVSRSRQIEVVDYTSNAMSRAGVHFRQSFGDRRARIIADENTWAAAGSDLHSALTASGIETKRQILPAQPRPKPQKELSEQLSKTLASDEVFVGLGSGVINDLVKYAAFRKDKDFMCVATAVSMDGYTSAGAPLSTSGFKMTIPCRAPKVIIADPDILANAPPEMVGWGYGDLAGKLPAGADWIIADALHIEAIDNVSWPMVQDRLPSWLSNPDKLATGDRVALGELFAGLALVGLAMEVHGSSRPASGADHQVAHLWEMENLHWNGEPVSHGACVAVATMAILRLYDWLVRQDLTELDVDKLVSEAVGRQDLDPVLRRHFDSVEFQERARAETLAKIPTPDVLEDRLITLKTKWPALNAKLKRHLEPAKFLKSRLQAAGAPTDGSDIGISDKKLRRTIEAARFIRSRYTILDLLAETGLLDQANDTVFPASSKT